MRTRHSGTLGALLLAALACNDDAAPSTDPVGGAGGSSAGSAGASGSSGAAGTSAGAGGDAGTSGSGGSGGTGGSADAPDASTTPRIQAVIDGAFVRLSSEDPVWVMTCNANMRLLQLVDGAWIPLQDDRPEGTNLTFESHYLDGTYEPYCQITLGCDYSICEPIAQASEQSFDQRANLIAREFVQVGEGAAPTCERGDAGVPLPLDAGADEDAGVQRVPVIESRAPRGPLMVRVRYYTSAASCGTSSETVDVPVE